MTQTENTSNNAITIFFVDDNDLSRDLVSRMITSWGYQARQAGNGKDALELVKQDAVDIILLDVMMPEMDGFEVCRRLKNDPDTASIPVVLLTALHDKESRMKGEQAGANGFLTKPFQMEELQVCIEALVRH